MLCLKKKKKKKGKGKAIPVTGPEKVWDVEAPTFSLDSRLTDRVSC
jgi:hypothetical protein